MSSSSYAPWGGDWFEAAVDVVIAAGIVEERVVVDDEINDDASGEFVGEIAAGENEDELVDDNIVAPAVDGESAPLTPSAPNDAAVPNVPVAAVAHAVSKPRDVEDTASSPSVHPSPLSIVISTPIPIPIDPILIPVPMPISICWRCISKSIIGTSGTFNPAPNPISS